MRAARVVEFGAPEAMRLEEVPDPVPSAGEVVVRVEAAAVNFVDHLVIAGTYQLLPPLPFVPGKLPAGTVIEVGEGVTDLRPGDRVQTLAEEGGYAERLAVPAAHCYRLPEELSVSDAASMSLGFDTAWFALHERGRLQPGEWVLVLGASGAVGRAAVQLARERGARVLAGVARPERFAGDAPPGLDGVVDLGVPDLRESLRAQVHARTGGAGVDVVVDPLGGDAFDAALRALAWRGRMVVVGFAAGRIPSVRANYLLVKNIEVSGLQVSDYRKREPAQMASCFREIFALYEAGRIEPMPVTSYPLAAYRAALHRVRERGVSRRVVLRPDR